MKRSESVDANSLDIFSYDKFVAGEYSKNTPECNEQDFLSDCIHLVPGKSAVEDHDETELDQGENSLCVIANVQSLVSLPDSENNSILPQTEGEESVQISGISDSVVPQADVEQGESSPNEDGTQLLAKEDLNHKNNNVMPQTEGDKGEAPPNEVDIHLHDKGDSIQNKVDIQLPDQ